MFSTEGESGTVGSEEFEDWVRDYLLPVLGKYERNEANSVLVLDNASTHNSDWVLQMIRAKGTYIIFTALYLDDLNPIELGFNIYKSHLKKNTSLFDSNWNSAHLKAVEAVTADIAIEEFRKCGVPGSNQVLTSDERKKLLVVFNLLLDI